MFRVWGPLAQSLRVEVNGRYFPAEPANGGWWVAEAVLKDGDAYRIELDNKALVPDPRSGRQPHGVHDASQYVDHSLFEWTDSHWQARPLSSAILYEIHIGTFTQEGTFEAAIERLDYLADLGISHIELMPVASFQGRRGWGYDGVALFAPHEAYGGPTGLKRLVDACHARGIGVLLDVVYNHLGPSGNYLPLFGPYFSNRHSTPWGQAINFDGPESDEVRRFFCDNALMWLRDYHFDGLRLDAVHAIIDTSAVPFLEQLASEVDDLKAHLGRHLVLIAESDLNDPRVIRAPELGGYGIDAQWSDDIHHSLHSVLTGEREGYYADFGTIEDLATSMQRPYVYAGRHSPHRRRTHGRPPLGLDGHQFVAFLQNHDQLGNRARGERLCHLTNVDRMKIGAALILTSPYIPMLFQGEEWRSNSPFLYFVDFNDEPELAQAVSEGRCREFAAFGWDPEAIPNPNEVATFLESKLNWDELNQAEHREMFDWYKSLIALRRSVSALTTGRLDLTMAKFDAEAGWLYVERGIVRIVCNFSHRANEMPCLSRELSCVLLSSKPGCWPRKASVNMPPDSVAILGPKALCQWSDVAPRRLAFSTSKSAHVQDAR